MIRDKRNGAKLLSILILSILTFGMMIRINYEMSSPEIVVEAGSVSLSPNGTVNVPISVMNIPSYESLGAYDIKVTFNNSIIEVLDVIGGSSPFDSITAKNIDNIEGTVRFNHFITSTQGATGNITIAYLKIRAVGAGGFSSNLLINTISLVDAKTGDEMPRTEKDGTIDFPTLEVAVSLHMGIDDIGYVVADVSFDSPSSLIGGLGAYELNLSLSNDMFVLSASGGQPPFNVTPTANKIGGKIVVVAFIPETQGPQMRNLLVARLRLRLNSTADDVCTMQPFGLNIVDAASGAEYGLTVSGESLTFRRGDANIDDRVSVADAMFIAQYLAGNRPASDLNLLNAASVKHDDAEGDKISIADAMFIVQYLAGIRSLP